MDTWEIEGHTLEFIEDAHIYLYDGVILQSITQILKTKFGKKYDGIDKATLNRASELGTQTHEAIERYCRYGEESDIPELRNFKFLQKQYGFNVIYNEIPVVLHDDSGQPISAGRLDMVISMDGKNGLADVKRTSTLDKEYLAYQLNLYRIAYIQTYSTNEYPASIDFLRGIHLRENIRKFVPIPINEEMAWSLIEEWRLKNE